MGLTLGSLVELSVYWRATWVRLTLGSLVELSVYRTATWVSCMHTRISNSGTGQGLGPQFGSFVVVQPNTQV